MEDMMAKGEVETLEKDADVAEKKGAPADQPEAAEQGGAAEQAGAAEQPQLDEKTRAALADMRGRIQLKAGQVMLAMMNLARYRDETLGDMRHLVFEPLMRDRIAVAAPQSAKPGQGNSISGFAIWATVSSEVSSKIRAQVAAGVFPIRLKGDEWACGESVWLLDVIAPSRELAAAVFVQFVRSINNNRLHIDPVVHQSIDKDVLSRMPINGDDPSDSLKTKGRQRVTTQS
jgi:hemolysin-activating ACP:hemolysin acyltransferase